MSTLYLRKILYVWPTLWRHQCCVWSCDTGKFNVYDKTRRREMMDIKETLHKSPSKIWFKNGIHRLADIRRSADIMYRMWSISLLCRSDTAM